MDLFGEAETRRSWREMIVPDAWVLRQFALPQAVGLYADIQEITRTHPFRQMTTPGGFQMSAGLSACGDWGWLSDRHGYRYAATDPLSGKPWPALPDAWRRLAATAADEAGFPGFQPDTCLINHYAVGAKMSLHQDRNEQDYAAPIVSVSLGLPALFQFGGLERSAKTLKVPLVHGDVVVWGRSARLFFHGVLPIKPGFHPLTGECRLNLTFRKAGAKAC